MDERRAYWERRIGPGRHFYTYHVALVVGKSQRTIQRAIASGRLRAVGGDRQHHRVLREDLLDYLLRIDSAVRR